MNRDIICQEHRGSDGTAISCEMGRRRRERYWRCGMGWMRGRDGRREQGTERMGWGNFTPPPPHMFHICNDRFGIEKKNDCVVLSWLTIRVPSLVKPSNLMYFNINMAIVMMLPLI